MRRGGSLTRGQPPLHPSQRIGVSQADPQLTWPWDGCEVGLDQPSALRYTVLNTSSLPKLSAPSMLTIQARSSLTALARGAVAPPSPSDLPVSFLNS